MLPELVQNLVTDLADAVEGRIRSAFDVARISKEVLAKGTSRTLRDSCGETGIVCRAHFRVARPGIQIARAD